MVLQTNSGINSFGKVRKQEETQMAKKSLEQEKKDMELKYWNGRPKPKVQDGEEESVELKNPTKSALIQRARVTHNASRKNGK
jgi:hypothetical protein